MGQYAVSVRSKAGDFKRLFRITATSEVAAVTTLYPEDCLEEITFGYMYRLISGTDVAVEICVSRWLPSHHLLEFYDVGHWVLNK